MASATPLLLLCNSKVPNYRKNKAFKDLGHYFEGIVSGPNLLS